MGLMRKAVRRATPRPVRKVKRVVTHPVRTTVRAATPRPIRQAQRQVFNATHPINTLENAFLDSLTASPRSRRRTSGRSSSGTVARSTATGPNSNVAAYERAARAEAIAQAEQRIFSHHMVETRDPRVVDVAPVAPPDVAAYVADCRRTLGVEVLEKELSAFGEPPVAPAASLPTIEAEADRLYRLAVSDVSLCREDTRSDANATLADYHHGATAYAGLERGATARPRTASGSPPADADPGLRRCRASLGIVAAGLQIGARTSDKYSQHDSKVITATVRFRRATRC
jgi:hypothetical protein